MKSNPPPVGSTQPYWLTLSFHLVRSIYSLGILICPISEESTFYTRCIITQYGRRNAVYFYTGVSMNNGIYIRSLVWWSLRVYKESYGNDHGKCGHYEVFITIVAAVESLLNSRPLVYIVHRPRR